MSEQRNNFYYTFAITAILFAMVIWTSQPPSVKPVSIPSNEFSGQRAYDILSHLIQENQAHPVGSEMNKIVKQRIIDELNKYNIENSVQETWQCSRSLYNCAFVENIIATIPGKEDRDYVTLMSHYDSVPFSPGAGDDGAAVAAMLESARILKSEAPFNKPIMMLFTDAEEIGLVGAEAFFNKHELADKVGIVLNFEGSGTTGVSQVLRTSGNNHIFMHAFQQESAYAKGASLINEIFKRMPNDTDFSVVKRSGIPGIDIAFANERNHYHTPNDNLTNIDIRTIQHHGENMLPITRWLANNDFESSDPNLVYNQFYSGWLEWQTNFTPILIAISLILMLLVYLRSNATLIGIAQGFGSSWLVMLLTGGACYGAFEIITFLIDTMVSWPAYELPFRITLFTSGLLGALIAATLCQRYLTTINGLMGSLVLWVILAIALYVYMPDAANIIVLPMLATSIVMFLASFLPERTSRYVLPMSLIVIVPALLGMVMPLEQTQGYRLIFVTMPFIALFMTGFVPLILGSKLKLAIAVTAIVMTGAIINAVNTPLYSKHRPQHVNIIYYEQAGADAGHYWFSHANPLPVKLQSVYELSPDPKSLLPYSSYQHRNWAEVPSADLPAPEVVITSVTATDSGRLVEMELSSPRDADSMQLFIPATAKLKAFTVGDFTTQNNSLGNWADDRAHSIRIIGSYDKTVSLKLTLESTETVEAYLIDRSSALPDSAQPLLAQRRGLVSPVHQGDVALKIRTISF